MMGRRNIIGSTLFALLVLPGFFAAGCGGGSVGTGVSTDRRSFEGRTITAAAIPIEGATVTLLNTGESTLSEKDGRFFLSSDFEDAVAELSVKSGELSGSIIVPNIQQGTAGIQLTIVLDAKDASVSASQLAVSARIVGACDPSFEDRRTIRQVSPLLDGTRCSLRVEVGASGAPLANVPVLLQRRRCIYGAPWHDEASAITESTANGEPGVASLPLNIFNNDAHCVYRVVAPVVENVEPVIYEIHTLRKQEFDRAHEANSGGQIVTPPPSNGTQALRTEETEN